MEVRTFISGGAVDDINGVNRVNTRQKRICECRGSRMVS